MTKEDLLVDGVATMVQAIIEAKKVQSEEHPEVLEETLADILLQLAFASHHFMKMTHDEEDTRHDVFETLHEMGRQCRQHMAMTIFEQANDDKEGDE